MREHDSPAEAPRLIAMIMPVDERADQQVQFPIYEKKTGQKRKAAGDRELDGGFCTASQKNGTVSFIIVVGPGQDQPCACKQYRAGDRADGEGIQGRVARWHPNYSLPNQ